MKTASIVLLSISASLLACGASQPSVEYLSEGLGETKITLEDYVDPTMSDNVRAMVLDAAQSEETTSAACRAAQENRLIPLVGQPFSMGEGFVCEYTAVEAAGDPAHRLVSCSAPRSLRIEIRGEVRPEFTDLRIRVGDTANPEKYAVTREVSRLIGLCAGEGREP